MIDGQPVLQLPRGSLQTCPAREAGATCLTSDQTLRLLFMAPSSAREPVWEWRVGTEWPSPVVPWWAVRWRAAPHHRSLCDLGHGPRLSAFTSSLLKQNAGSHGVSSRGLDDKVREKRRDRRWSL